MWYLICYYLFFSNFFYFMYILIFSFRSQLFSFQLRLFVSFCLKISFFFFLFSFFFSYFFLPSFLSFLVKWQFLNSVQGSVSIELTPLLAPYIFVILKLRSFFFFFLFSFFFFLFSFFFFLFELKFLCIQFRSTFYGIISLISLFGFTLNVQTQSFMFLFIFFSLELFYLYILLKSMIQTKFTNDITTSY